MERSPEAPQHSTTLRETLEQIMIGYQKQNSNDKSAAIIAPKQTGQKPMPESGSRLLNDLQQVFHKIGRARLLNDSQPASESIYTEPEAVQTEKAAQTISLAQPTEAEMLEAATAEFFKLALANTVYAEPTQVPQPQSLSGAAPPAVPTAASPIGSPTPVSSMGAGAPVSAAATTAGAGPTAANPSNIKGLHQIMQQFMPGATAGGPGRPLPGLGGQGGPSVGQGSSSATGGKAAPLPGAPGHVATNVIDQRGALDPTGRTVDGNNSSTVQKFAALIQQHRSAEPDRFQRFAEICRSAVNKNQTKTASAYGYCPQCGAPGESRERRLNGNDKCQNGHTYPSSKATSSPIEKSASTQKQAADKITPSWERLPSGDVKLLANTPEEYVRLMQEADDSADRDFSADMHEMADDYNASTKPWYSAHNLNRNIGVPLGGLLSLASPIIGAAVAGDNPALAAGIGGGIGAAGQLPWWALTRANKATAQEMLHDDPEAAAVVAKHAPKNGIGQFLAPGALGALAGAGWNMALHRPADTLPRPSGPVGGRGPLQIA